MEYLKFDNATMLLGVVGYPLAHVRVQKVYNALFEKFSVNALYLPFPVRPDQLGDFFHAADVLNMPGFGVTMPHKTAVLPYLDSADEICKVYNCVNTVSVDAGKKKHGYAFDGFAMCQMVEDEGVLLKNRRALVLGAGGISGVVCDELARRGVTAITILNRTREKAEALAELVAAHTGVSVMGGGLTKAALDGAAEDAGIVMQCTSLGLYGGGQDYACLDFIDRLPPGAVVADAIYNPNPTSLLAKAAAKGLQAIGGLGMLACQKQQIFKACLQLDIGDEGKKMVGKVITGATT